MLHFLKFVLWFCNLEEKMSRLKKARKIREPRKKTYEKWFEIVLNKGVNNS